MRLKSFLLMLIVTASIFCAYAQRQEANVNVILEIEGEYKFEPFKEWSEGLAGLLNNGFIRVIRESEPGLAKYAALNEAMQKARTDVWNAVVYSYISDGITIKDAIKNAPTYYDYKEKEGDKEKLAAMTKLDREAFVKANGKEKKYDLDLLLDSIKECGNFKNSGRFYDAVEQIGYACLEISKENFFKAVENEKINIFKDIQPGDRYRPVESRGSARYDAVIIDATEIDYQPNLYVKVLSPTEETVYAGIAGKKKITFAANLDEAKKLLGSMGVRRVYNAKSIGKAGDVGLLVSLPSADAVYYAVSGDKNLPFVILYNNAKQESEVPAAGE